MINFRELFNIRYSYFMILIIFLLVGVIILLNRNLKSSLKTVGITILVSGIITLFLALVMELGINILIPYQYKILIQVISNSVFMNLLYGSGINIVLGSLCMFLSKLDKKIKIN